MNWLKRLLDRLLTRSRPAVTEWHPALPGLRSDDYRTRCAAVQALAATGEVRAAQALTAASGTPLWGQSDGEPSEYDTGECAALVRLGAVAVDPLITELRQRNNSHYASRTCLAALVKIGPPQLVDILIELARRGDYFLSCLAITELGKLRDPRIVDELLSIYRTDKTVNVADSAFVELSNFTDDPRVLPVLLQAVKAGAGGSVRVLASLGKSRDPSVYEPLASLLEHPHPSIRQNAAIGLGHFGDSRAIEPLMKLLAKHPDCDIGAMHALGWLKAEAAVAALESRLRRRGFKDDRRDVAARALVSIGSEAAYAVLRKAMTDPFYDVPYADRVDGQPGLPLPRTYSVAHSVVEAVAVRGNVQGRQLLLSVFDSAEGVYKRSVAAALGAIGDHAATDTLLGAMHGQDAELKRSAIMALGELGDERAVPALVAEARRKSLDDCEAVKSLGKIGGRAAIDALLGALVDERCLIRCEAADALARIGDPCALEPMERLLSDKESVVRYRAELAIDKLRRIENKDGRTSRCA